MSADRLTDVGSVGEVVDRTADPVEGLDPTEGPDPAALTAEDLAFRARALAQAHALTERALAYRAWRVGRDKAQHSIPELSTWAATAFLTGYCVRCVEESWPTANMSLQAANLSLQGKVLGATGSFEEWASRGSIFADSLARDPDTTLVEHRCVLDALDNVIGKEIDKRAEHVKEQVSGADWNDFETFIAWWVLHGYSIRSVEA